MYSFVHVYWKGKSFWLEQSWDKKSQILIIFENEYAEVVALRFSAKKCDLKHFAKPTEKYLYRILVLIKLHFFAKNFRGAASDIHLQKQSKFVISCWLMIAPVTRSCLLNIWIFNYVNQSQERLLSYTRQSWTWWKIMEFIKGTVKW